jgi:hypothetical protein
MALYDDIAIMVSSDRWMGWDTSAYPATLVEYDVLLGHADRWHR